MFFQFIRYSLLDHTQESRSPFSLPLLLFLVRYDFLDSVYVYSDLGQRVRLLSLINLENDRSYLWNSPHITPLRHSLRSLLASKVPELRLISRPIEQCCQFKKKD
ncbi:hypothetical protein LEP1GSC037_2937 [Leptospira interrogans str. 2006001854]|uniref:Uncharacterized protein n=1 Tax=Leptospira interrogans str. 2006001854 TaxID=1001590 RepID=M6GGI7_LEPIR|nr:hypothetical protein LEP1GSC037_2937 [Leptospira interrogans str. 2006001854]